MDSFPTSVAGEPERRLSAPLAALAVTLFGLAAWLLLHDIGKTLRQALREPDAVRIADANLRLVSDPKNGWFPTPHEPIYAWEQDEQGWKLEEDEPLALSPHARAQAEEDTSATAGLSAESAASSAAAGGTGLGAQASGTPKKLHLTSKEHSEGQSALAVPVHFPDPATVFRFNATPLDPNRLVGVRFIAYDVFVPADCPGFVGALFFMKDKDGLWYQARSQAALLPGRWTTVTADLRGGSPDVTPLGHVGQWDDNQASQIKTIGITLYGDRPYRGEVCIDNFRGWVRAQRFAAQTDPQTLPNADAARQLKKLKAEAEAFKEEPLRILNFRTELVPLAEPRQLAAQPVPPVQASAGNALAANDRSQWHQDEAPVVPRFETLTLRFELNRQIDNPFDPEKCDVTCVVQTPDGQTLTHVGFWYQDYDLDPYFAGEELSPIGRPEWRVRITPRVTGLYQYSVRVKVKDELLAMPIRTFRCVESKEPGFIRVSDRDKRFFEYETGKFFYPIGHNLHTTVDMRCWHELLKEEPPAGRGLSMYADFFDKMQRNGENTTEVWMASWWLGIEWTARWRDYYGPGRYSLAHAWKLDRLLAMARAHGLHVHLVIDNHGKFSSYCDWEWDLNPYNLRSDPNGAVNDANQFFTDPTCQKWHRDKLRYIVARWGADPAVLGWELVSEYDLVGGGPTPFGRAGNINQRSTINKSPPVREWLKKMLPYLHQCDVYQHPVTNHYATDYTWVDEDIARSPLLDYVTTDAYRAPEPYVGAAVRMQRWFTADIAGAGVKPFWITEYGGNFDGVRQISQMDADLHCGLWATWMTDGGGAPLLWWYDYIDHTNLYSHYRAFAQYAQGEDRRGILGKIESLPVIGEGPAVASIAYRWNTGAYAWVYDRAAMTALPEASQRVKHENLTDKINGLAPGKYRVEYWDCYTGAVVSSEETQVQANVPLPLKFPAFYNDLAVKVKREQ